MWNPDRELVKLNATLATLATRCLSYLRHLFKRTGQNKTDRIKNYIGYTFSELRERLTTHPNWQKVKDNKWHIDHVFPVKAFLEHGITDMKVINALDNLQPLSQPANLKKSSKYDKSKFKEWLATKGITV